MKTKTKIGVAFLSLTFLLLFIVPGVDAGSCEYNTGCGVYAHSQERIQQTDVAPYADNLEFTAWQKEDLIQICGYRVTIDCFPTVDCTWGDAGPDHHEVDVTASGADVYPGEFCEISVEFWLNPDWNTVRKKDLRWTRGTTEIPGPPDHGWKVHGNVITIFNDDPIRSFAISGLEWYASLTHYPDIKVVPFDNDIPGDYVLAPGEYREFGVTLCKSEGYGEEGHVYFHFEIRDGIGGTLLSEEWADHEIFPRAVGGFAFAVDKFGLLAPYIGVASTIVAGTVASLIYIKRRKKHQ